MCLPCKVVTDAPATDTQSHSMRSASDNTLRHDPISAQVGVCMCISVTSQLRHWPACQGGTEAFTQEQELFYSKETKQKYEYNG